MRPPVSGTMRTPVCDLRLGPYTLPAGTLININLGVMGNSALNYASPELYLPARPSAHPHSGRLCHGRTQDAAHAGVHNRAYLLNGKRQTAACAAPGAVGGVRR